MKEIYIPFIEGAFVVAFVVAGIAIFAAFIFKIIKSIINDD